jgi:hypothetical protein
MMEKRGIKKENLGNILKNNPTIIEYHFKNNSHRLLIRSNKPMMGRRDICIVIDLFSNFIITAYACDKHDFHPTLDTSMYDDFDIKDFIKTHQ